MQPVNVLPRFPAFPCLPAGLFAILAKKAGLPGVKEENGMTILTVLCCVITVAMGAVSIWAGFQPE